jgi:hypothetical protein
VGAPTSVVVPPVPQPIVDPKPIPQPAVEPTVIDSFGSLKTLRKQDGTFVLQPKDGSRSPVDLVLGDGLTGYQVVGAEPWKTGYQAILKNGAAYRFATFGSDGRLIKSKAIRSSKLTTYERIFSQDLNGDSVIGAKKAGTALQAPPAAPAAALRVDLLTGDSSSHADPFIDAAGAPSASADGLAAPMIQNFLVGSSGDALAALGDSTALDPTLDALGSHLGVGLQSVPFSSASQISTSLI